MDIIAITGPARAGKDSLCKEILKRCRRLGFSAERVALADPLWDAVEAISGEFLDRHSDEKDAPLDCLFGYSPRDWAIAIGQGTRVHLGEEIWLKLWQKRAAAAKKRGIDVVVCPDVRTATELEFCNSASAALLVGLVPCHDGPPDEILVEGWQDVTDMLFDVHGRDCLPRIAAEIIKSGRPGPCKII